MCCSFIWSAADMLCVVRNSAVAVFLIFSLANGLCIWYSRWPVHFVLIFMKWTVCSARGRGPIGYVCACVCMCVLLASLCLSCISACVQYEGYTNESRYLCLHKLLVEQS